MLAVQTRIAEPAKSQPVDGKAKFAQSHGFNCVTRKGTACSCMGRDSALVGERLRPIIHCYFTQGIGPVTVTPELSQNCDKAKRQKVK